MSKQYFWIAINGPSCSMCPMPLKKPLVSPTPEQMFGFPTYEEAKHAQHIYLTAPMPKVEEFLRSLQPDIRFGRLARVRPKNPQPHSRGATMYVAHYSVKRCEACEHQHRRGRIRASNARMVARRAPRGHGVRALR